MSRLVAQFDPSAVPLGSFQTQAPNPGSWLHVMNESANFIQLDLGTNGQPIIQPWFNRLFQLPQVIQDAAYRVVATLQSGGAPISQVYVEAYQPNERISANLEGALFRQSNVGNAAAVSAATSSVQNDGNAAGTTVLEATPSGAASSQALITNEGAAILGGGLLVVSKAGVVTAIPAGAIPAVGVGTGYPAASLGAGALPGGVTIAGSQVIGATTVGAVASVADSTSTPQLQTETAQAGLSVKNSVAGLVEVYPTSDGTTAEALQFDYQDGAGALHPAFKMLTTVNVWNVAGQLLEVTTSNAYPLGTSFNGTGGGTYSHNMRAGKNPMGITITPNEANSTQTVGVDSLTSTTVHVNMPQAWPFYGLAFLC